MTLSATATIRTVRAPSGPVAVASAPFGRDFAAGSYVDGMTVAQSVPVAAEMCPPGGLVLIAAWVVGYR
jgi:hypothetical protein